MPILAVTFEGPLLKKLPVPLLDGKERVFQFGIVSSGTPNNCGYEGRPAIYTNVLYHVPWILKKLETSYSLESVESFSAELKSLSSREQKSSEENQNATDQDEYKYELSTGRDVDIMSHPNLSKLPSLQECGNIPPVPKNRTVIDSEDFDDSVEVEYDDDNDDDGDEEGNKPEEDGNVNKKRAKRRSKRMVGGRVAGIGWFPFLAQIYLRDGGRFFGTCFHTKININILLYYFLKQ